MKYILLFFLSFIGFFLKGQTDFIIGGVAFSSSSITVGGTSEFTALVSVNGTNSNGAGSLGVGCLQVIISLPANGCYIPGPNPPSGFGTSFTWTYVPSDKAYYGTNNTVLSDGDGGLISLNVIGATTSPSPSITSINLSDTNSCTTSNNGSNDSGFAGLIVSTPLPVDLVSFQSNLKKCDEVEIGWKTESEVNNAHFELLKSEDGEKFELLSLVPSKLNARNGASYSYIDKGNFKEGVKFYYKLVQVDYDGQKNTFDMIEQNYSCDEDVFNLKLYPNPATNDLNIECAGYSNDESIKLKIINEFGVIVKVIDVKPSHRTSVDISDLPLAIYEIQSLGSKNFTNKKFIKVN